MSGYTTKAATMLEPQHQARLARMAKRKGLPLSVFIRMVLMEYLEREDPAGNKAEGAEGEGG